MRKYKFRGKSLALDTKGTQWVYGSLVVQNGIPFIYEDKIDGSINYHQALKDTVGQFTGLLDKNGVEIYEGDVVKQYYPYNNEIWERTDPVEWNEIECSFMLSKGVRHFHGQELEIIGNIHDEVSK